MATYRCHPAHRPDPAPIRFRFVTDRLRVAFAIAVVPVASMGYLAEHTVHCDRLPLVGVARAVPDATLAITVGQPNQGGPPPFVVTAGAGSRDGAGRRVPAGVAPTCGRRASPSHCELRRFALWAAEALRRRRGLGEGLERLAAVSTLEYLDLGHGSSEFERPRQKDPTARRDRPLHADSLRVEGRPHRASTSARDVVARGAQPVYLRANPIGSTRIFTRSEDITDLRLYLGGLRSGSFAASPRPSIAIRDTKSAGWPSAGGRSMRRAAEPPSSDRSQNPRRRASPRDRARFPHVAVAVPERCFWGSSRSRRCRTPVAPPRLDRCRGAHRSAGLK